MPITPDELFLEAYTTKRVAEMRKSINKNKRNTFKLTQEAAHDIWIEVLTRTVERMNGYTRCEDKQKAVAPAVFETMEDALNYVRVAASNYYVWDISKKYHRETKEYDLYKHYVLANVGSDEEQTKIKISYAEAWDVIFTYLRREDYKYYTFGEVAMFKHYFDGGKIDGSGKKISYRSLAKEVGKSYNYVSRVINKILDDLRKNFANQLADIDFEE